MEAEVDTGGSGVDVQSSPPVPAPPSIVRSQDTGPRKRLAGRVIQKRTYGNRLVFFDIREDVAPVQKTDSRNTLLHDAVEAVFSFEVYGSDVRMIRKDICIGDIVEFHGTYRSCGHILDVIEYKILTRWRDVTEHPFNPVAYGGRKTEDHGGKSVGVRLGGPDDTSGALMCKFWLSNKNCQREGCQCEHPDGEELAEARRQYWDLLRQKRARSANPDDPHSADGKKGHAQRAAVFADWLCSTFGLDTLRGSGVVDVAGGRGELSFELAIKRQIPCTVIDPRCPTLGIEAWSGFKVSKPQRSWLEASVPGVHGFPACQEHVAASAQLRQCSARVLPGCAEPQADARPWWAQVVGDAHVIVGLHPDQATSGVLDLALAFNKAFAVVPCCTFADDFPERMLPGEKAVRTYDDLVKWLTLRRAGTETTFMPFQGKNLVVFNARVGAEPASTATGTSQQE